MAKANILDETIPDGTTQTWSMATKENQDCDTAVNHTVTFDFSGVTLRAVLDDCVRHLKVKLQQKVRKNMVRYPAGDLTVKVGEMLSGRSGIVVTKATVLAYAAQSRERREELLAELLKLQEADDSDNE